MYPVKSLSVAFVALLCFAQSSPAAVVFYVNDQAGFNAATASFNLAGTEDFEGSNLAPAQGSTVDDPLVPGVANGVFPSGTLASAGVSVRSNTLGANPTSLSPHGAFGLSTASAGYIGTPSDQISNNYEADSFDLTFAPSNGQYVRGVGMAPLYFGTGATTPTSHSGSLQIRVYAADQTTLLGTQTITGVNFSGSSFLGVVSSGGDVIGRINIWDLDAVNHWQGADNVSVRTTVPLPVELMEFEIE
ncbi:MAG: hypothetical protein IPP07_00360 [Holophagales bacterium]|jgi:hypothetical protein|nr:hypothetical protein [Holophagales bacterium]MBK9963416.1 hypothetical protein [Holophagales bacterium]